MKKENLVGPDDVNKIVDQVIASRADEIKTRVAEVANWKIDQLLETVQVMVPISEEDFARIVGYSAVTIARLRKARKIQYRGLANRPYYLFPEDVEAFHEAMLHRAIKKPKEQ